MNQEIKDKAIARLYSADALPKRHAEQRSPVHVVYGGAHLFTADTPSKFGRVALKAIETYAPNFADFANALWLKGADSLPTNPEQIQEFEFLLADNPEKAKAEMPEAWFAWSVFQQTIEKLKNEPVEDYRIDFEDGYGIRTDEEEDSHCISASTALAEMVQSQDYAPAAGFRIKSFQPETRQRAFRTLEVFLANFVEQTGGSIPDNFVVTLPKIKSPVETEILAGLLSDLETANGLPPHSIGIEILIETPESILVMADIAKAADGRCTSAHFGAFDYTSSYGISAQHQHLRHDACNFARNMMQVSLAPLGLRLSDSVTTEMPIPIHRGENLSIVQIAENRLAVREAWRKHFNNITHSQINGFYQSWDLHPAQLAARYAAVYSFFLDSFDAQSKRLRGFLEKATQAMTTGNIFDDLASAEGLLNFFTRGVQCGAFSIQDVEDETGLTQSEFNDGSFVKIMEKRFSKRAG